MKDLISKSALLDWLAPFEDMEKVGMPQIIEVIQSRPTIEAAPVVRGRWVEYMPILGAGDKQARCSECGLTPSGKTPYCPSCGARMDGESNA